MKKYLPDNELRFYFCFTVVFYVTLMYNVYMISNSTLSAYDTMDDGWNILNRKIDNYDSEWQVLKDLFGKYWYWFVIHIVCSEVYRLFRIKNISALYFIIGSIACLKIYNIKFLIVLILQTLVCFGVSTVFRKKRHVWLLSTVWLVILNSLKSESFFDMVMRLLDVDESKVHDFLVIFAWCILKNISFNLEKIASDDNKKFSLLNCFGYMFYFPTFHCGPIFIYSRYMHMLNQNDTLSGQNYDFEAFKSRLKDLIINLLRYFAWYLMTEIGLHYFYIHYIVISRSLDSLNIFGIFGLGVLNGQFFNNKYIIQYGVPIVIGRFEYIPMPNTPKCICRVNKYSDMWKWFDNGLYEFLLKYIYMKMTKKSSSIAQKIFASFITFFFIYIWHGFFDYILIWSVANCVCIVIEKFLYDYIESEKFKNNALKYIKTENNLHRLRAFLGAHILIPAVLSNFFFFGGTKYGMEFVHRTYTNGLLNYLKISFTIFLLYPIAEAIKIYEQRNNAYKKLFIN